MIAWNYPGVILGGIDNRIACEENYNRQTQLLGEILHPDIRGHQRKQSKNIARQSWDLLTDNIREEDDKKAASRKIKTLFRTLFANNSGEPL